jgi:REP element-mobilizing transposase RayT
MDLYERRLPHLAARHHPVFVTWRLHGTLPKNRIFPEYVTSGRAFAAMDKLLDLERDGALYLRLPEIASLTVQAFFYGAEKLRFYELHAYVVMANHIHLLITPAVDLAKITHSLKRYTAREANRGRGLTGKRFWQDESYDRLVRGGAEFQRIRRYIEYNPVRAGLVTLPEEYTWSSAGRRLEIGAQLAKLPH